MIYAGKTLKEAKDFCKGLSIKNPKKYITFGYMLFNIMLVLHFGQ